MHPVLALHNPQKIYGMNEIAKWVWLIILAVLFAGPYVFIYIGVCTVLFFLVLWLKPEWLRK